ncbi:DUF1345 domain-containing protein [Amnibacterium setariae]|uniref:DUF1345 domain-containing protein n=1 Tax=Amnibacterium setariae TaxID=2306585 RepID=A0A3A1U3G6_9MICO|nr:DUF1345 domain-containing protein [Amnibacterium setariae]RIX28387.1 DUF1345 domain-containing protein [Amnibacterium setariae]
MAQQRRSAAEYRWPPVLAIVVALALYATLPSDVPVVLRAVVVVLGVVLIVPVVLLNPRRVDRETRWSRGLSTAQVLLLLVANHAALAFVIHALLTAKPSDGPVILLATLQVWVTNVIAYGLAYWEIDRGGPVARTVQPRNRLPHADFRFPQDEDADAVREVASGSSEKSGWVAAFIDYLYFSLTNSMAFSPTDVMPLTTRAKIAMGLEAFVAFVILALVIARGVSLLS